MIRVLLAALLTHLVVAQDHQDTTTTLQPGATTTLQGSTSAVDTCVESAKKNIQDNLGRSFPQFQNLTQNLTAPREFYQKLFNQPFNKDTYLQYCNAYKTNRAELDKCPNTTAKTLAQIQLSLPDYVCMQRVDVYADAIACLQNLNNNAEVISCRGSKCAINEQKSINAKNPPANATKAQLAEFAVGDCLYTKCTADCRQEGIKKTCRSEQSELELEALKLALSSAQSISQSLNVLKTAASHALQEVFPDECRDASLTLRIFAGAGADYLSAAVNGTFNLLQSIQNGTTTAPGVGATTKHPGAGASSVEAGLPWPFIVALVFTIMVL